MLCDILDFGKKIINCNSLFKAIRKETLGFSYGDGRATGKGRELLLYSNNRNHQSSILTVEIQKKERKELGLLAFSTSMDKHTKVGGVSHAIF